MVDPAIFRLTFLLAVGDYPVQGETKQRWIVRQRSTTNPKRMDQLSQVITAMLNQEKKRLVATISATIN
jgi:hypothetical protein